MNLVGLQVERGFGRILNISSVTAFTPTQKGVLYEVHGYPAKPVYYLCMAGDEIISLHLFPCVAIRATAARCGGDSLAAWCGPTRSPAIGGPASVLAICSASLLLLLSCCFRTGSTESGFAARGGATLSLAFRLPGEAQLVAPRDH